ncbi:hypothetical protein GGS26DRAFT_540133 [Hypomontagnella submonticulosa]|nr:hypothetical protein GGS26DRAFT_540133 [Hypomontagnella submonticulosa]
MFEEAISSYRLRLEVLRRWLHTVFPGLAPIKIKSSNGLYRAELPRRLTRLERDTIHDRLRDQQEDDNIWDEPVIIIGGASHNENNARKDKSRRVASSTAPKQAPRTASKLEKVVILGNALPILRQEALASNEYSDVRLVETTDPFGGHAQEESDPRSALFAIKTHHGKRGRPNFERELHAYETITAQENYDQHVVCAVSAFSDGESHNIVLEYADGGNLEWYFEHIDPPSNNEQFTTFWESILRFYTAVQWIHGDEIARPGRRAWKGAHLDLKPTNILIFGRSSSSQYNFIPKISDFETFQEMPEGCENNSVYKLLPSSVTYDAPECSSYPHSKITFSRLQKCDLWSAGCILSEALVWSILGIEGLKHYRQSRETENKGTRSQGSNAFHDGKKVLRAVAAAHLAARGVVKTAGSHSVLELTDNLLGLVSSLLLFDPESRIARIHVHQLMGLISGSLARDMSDGTRLKPLSQSHANTPSLSSFSATTLQDGNDDEIADLQLLTPELREVPAKRISIVSSDVVSVSDTIKGVLEDTFQEKWIWWPLGSRLRRLQAGKVWLQWTCGCGEDRSEQVQAEIAKQIINVKRLVYYPNSPELPASVHIPLQSFPRSRLQESRPIGTQLPMARRTAAQHGTPNDQHLIHQRITVTSPNSSPTKDPRNVFFIIGSGPKPGDLHWLSQENVVNWGTANFFIWLRGEYYKRRGGIWRWLFRIRVLSHCDFFKFKKFGNDEFEPVKMEYPAGDNSDYHFEPKPMLPLPPISDHEFARRLKACYEPTNLHFFHRCRKPCSSRDVLPRIPKRKRRLETEGESREEFWGIYARERISALRVFIYNAVCLTPSIAFFFAWLFQMGIRVDNDDQDTSSKLQVDLQNPSIPLTITIGLLGLFWGIMFVDKNNRMAALRDYS